MPIAAIRYDIKAGCEEEIAEIVSGFTRPRSSVVVADDGAEAARIVSTAVFIKDDTMVRFIEYEGDITAVARFMATQPGVQDFERRIVPYLASPRDTGTVDGFVRTFQDSVMRCLAQFGRR
ncbi:SchA/CurD like domain-containing protein [Amycolatopsis arida]|uniref:SchA/CurD like domain-containing protein n=1 Tax=Amycolatopsis arida TaxID=587909 RepID=A0A1I6A7T6_9PSEU|nr:SchA/CurD-like domain-containing protein [Amycolatopsis arida]TDX88540.1 SchA/CurD like domain-containing protein [Amycolatopsis arida]SFQ64738.1 SchA/CurD like domain-containing protein [Amycolatopsis arida]